MYKDDNDGEYLKSKLPRGFKPPPSRTINNVMANQRYRHIRNLFIVAIAIVVLFSLMGCSDSDNDCAIRRLEIIDKAQIYIDIAWDDGDMVLVDLLVKERNDNLEDLGC